MPSVPTAPRFLTSPTRDYVHFGWWKSTANGSEVTSYRAARRCVTHGVYGVWVYVDVHGSVYYTNFRGLAGTTTCRTKVRAPNRVGHSGWSKVSTITQAGVSGASHRVCSVSALPSPPLCTGSPPRRGMS